MADRVIPAKERDARIDYKRYQKHVEKALEPGSIDTRKAQRNLAEVMSRFDILKDLVRKDLEPRHQDPAQVNQVKAYQDVWDQEVFEFEQWHQKWDDDYHKHVTPGDGT